MTFPLYATLPGLVNLICALVAMAHSLKPAVVVAAEPSVDLVAGNICFKVLSNA